MLSWFDWGRLFSEPFTAVSMVEDSFLYDLAYDRISCLFEITNASLPM